MNFPDRKSEAVVANFFFAKVDVKMTRFFSPLFSGF
jgi:hypothetical protein